MSDRGDDDDAALVAAFLRARDEGSFRALYRRHAAGVYGLALRLCGGRAAEADDVAQEAWVRAVRGLAGFRGAARLRTWLCGIAVNVWRESRRVVWDAEPEEVAVAARDRRGEVAALVDTLPPGARAVLVLHDGWGYTHAEIAALLGIEDGTSKSQLSRARAALRARLGEEIA